MKIKFKVYAVTTSVSLVLFFVKKISKNKRVLSAVGTGSTSESNYHQTGACFLLGSPEITNFMCKFAGKKNSILADNKKRVRLFFRKPRYTHYCSVWYIIESAAAAAEKKTVNGADRRARIN